MLKITDAANFRRTLAGLCLIAAPLAGLAATVVHPPAALDIGERLTMVAEYPTRFLASNLLAVLVQILLVPALLGLLHLLKGRGVVLGHIGGGLALAGVFGYMGVLATEFVVLEMAAGGRQEMIALAERVYGSVGFGIFLLMFLLGLLLGFIILSVALWRARIAPIWAAACIAVGSVLDFVASTSTLAVVLTWILFLIGLGWVGLKLLGMSDEDWAQGRVPDTVSMGPAAARPQAQ
jgi:hypothetical protein